MELSKPAAPQPENAAGGEALGGGTAVLRYLRRVRPWGLAYWETWLVLGMALLLVLYYLRSAKVLGLPYDDSYISLQFARNLARHGFLTFDGESASAGATSLLHVALLSVPIKLGIAPVRASVGLGIVFHLGLILAVYWLAWTIFRDRLSAALSGASVAVIGYLAMDALNGMETTLFLLLTAAAAAAFLGAESGRGYLAAGLLAALAVLTRPEGALLVAAMAGYDVVDPGREDRLFSAATARRLALLGGPSAAVLFGLAMFYLATTGSLTPGTATAKYLFFREFEWSLQARADETRRGVANFVAPVLPWLVTAVFAVRRREALLFAFYWVAFIIMYFMLFPGGLTHYWYRYQHVFLPPIAVFGSAGVVALVRSRRWQAWDIASAAVIGVVLVGATVFQYISFRDSYARDIHLNETRQVGMALWLRAIVPADSTIATHDIGTIGYYSEREVIDLVGLVNPDAIKYHDGRRLREYVDQVKPDYIVVFPSWERRFLHLGLTEEPLLFEEVQRFGAAGAEPFVLYRTHY